MKAGLIRSCSFSVEFRKDVFIYLFKDKGTKVDNKRGLMYNRGDFTDSYFSDDFFTFYNKFGECCKIGFPVHMYSFVKFSSVRYNKVNFAVLPCSDRDFKELLSISVVKKYV